MKSTKFYNALIRCKKKIFHKVLTPIILITGKLELTIIFIDKCQILSIRSLPKQDLRTLAETRDLESETQR